MEKQLSLSAEIARLRRTANWSAAGLSDAWRDEKSFRQWIWANAIAGIGLIALQPTPLEACFLLVLGMLVLVAELFNSAIEATVDYISTDHHPLARKAKDIASGAVMLTALAWGLSWCIIFGARLI